MRGQKTRQASGWRNYLRPRLFAEALEPRLLLAVIFSDNFDGGTFPSGWTRNTSQSRRWDFTGKHSNTAPYGVHCAKLLDGTSTNTYVNNLDTWFERTVDLRGYTSASLSFWRWQNTEVSFDYLRLKITGSNGVTDEPFNRSGATTGQQHTVPLDSYAGQNSVTIRFEFTSDATTVPSGDAGVWLDDIILTADSSNSTPNTPTFNSVPSPAKLYPSTYPNSPDDTNGPYSVTVDYTDPNGAADFQHTYLQLNGGPGVQSQTIMYFNLTNPVQWAGQGDHLTNLSANKVAITNGYRVTYSFQVKDDWTPSTNVDFEAFSLDKGGAESAHRINEWNGTYDSGLTIADARLVNLVDNDGDGYYSSVTAEADADTSVTSRAVKLVLYRRDSGLANSGWYEWDTGSYTTNGVSIDYKGAVITANTRGIYDFGWELYDPSWYITNLWYDADADVSNIRMEPVSEDVKIDAAYWLAPVDKVEGDVATARVRVSGYTTGTSITFDLYEDDGLFGSDYVTTLTGQVYFDNVSQAYFADVNWTTVWQSDQSGDPEFYFTAHNGSISLTSSRAAADEITVARRAFNPFFADARITNTVDQDGDGYARSFDIEFDVDSNVTGNYYVKVYEDDGGFGLDDYLLTGSNFVVSGSAADYHSVHINCDNFPGLDLLSHGTAEFRLDLYDATDVRP
jgi:hypothetical protein